MALSPAEAEISLVVSPDSTRALTARSSSDISSIVSFSYILERISSSVLLPRATLLRTASRSMKCMWMERAWMAASTTACGTSAVAAEERSPARTASASVTPRLSRCSRRSARNEMPETSDLLSYAYVVAHADSFAAS